MSNGQFLTYRGLFGTGNRSWLCGMLFLVVFMHNAGAADVTVQPASGGSFVVQDSTGTNTRLRVNENGQVTIPVLGTGPQQTTAVCFGAGGLIGPCAPVGNTLTLPFTATQSDPGALFSINNTGGGPGIAASTGATGTGSAATFSNANAANTSNTLFVTTNGPGVIADHSQGNAGNFFNNNTNGVGAGVRGEVNSIFGNNGTAGVYGVASGTGGYGGYFEHSNASGFGYALFVTTNSLGVAAHVETLSSSNAQPTLDVVTGGTGSGASIVNTNNSNVANTLFVTTNGPGVIADHSQGNAGNFFNNNTNGVGAGVRGEVNSIFGNNGTAGVYGVASGTGGYAGYFEHTDTTGFGITLQVVSNDLGTVLVVDHEGTGNLAEFQSASSNVARIDQTGKGFFDGGTQTGGADVAEVVPTSGALPESGDVVEIDPDQPDHFRLASEANSARVAGVISTMPGVTLIDGPTATEADNAPALALSGRVPVKVTNQGGPIHIGDLLVASAVSGHAMRAPNVITPGTIIGKALQNFDQVDGRIKMLIWPL